MRALDEPMDPRLVAALVEGQFPELSPVTAVALGEGCDSSAFEVNGQWVFRFPKRADVEQQLVIEARLLPVLTASSPLPLPAFRFHGRPCPEFGLRVVGYPKLPGVPAIDEALPIEARAPALGSFLSWLHRQRAGEAARLGVPRDDMSDVLAAYRADALAEFPAVSQVADADPVDKWHTFMETRCPELDPESVRPVLLHGDLAAEHVLWDRNTHRITGIIDWSDVAIGDPARDLSGIVHWGGEATLSAVLASYTHEVDDGTKQRARYLAACRGVADVAFGLEHDKPEYVRGGLRALRRT